MSDKLTYAIGDVHGRLDLLEAATEIVRSHLAGRWGQVVMLGDYVDRGPDSAGVISRLMAESENPAVKCLKGNHEDMMVRACRSGEAEDAFHWLCNGGDATLRSYGAEDDQRGLSAVPAAHLDWMAGLPTILRDAHRVYVHAGIMPGLEVEQNGEGVCLWIREKFLRAKADVFPAGVHIVHGHTPYWACKPNPAKPELLPHRTNLDSAAFKTGVLTIGVFDPAVPGGPIEVLRATA